MRIKPRYLVIFSLLFVAFTIIGTLSHELGHYTMARLLGYDAVLHYGSTSYALTDTGNNTVSDDLAKQLFITSAGPLQTIITGLVGLMILYLRRTRNRQRFDWFDWFAGFMSLFWLREVFNLSISAYQLTQGYLAGGDEIRIAQFLGLPSLSLAVILGLIGLSVAIFVVFRKVPRDMRPTFILSGFIGGLLGFELWMHHLGPALLP